MDLEKVGPSENVCVSLGTYLEGDSVFLTASIVITALLHEFLL